jgi:poly-beta-1,6-N-acetyl-D-glucosamine synthase
MPSYCVISPVRDEARHLPSTIRSMATQTLPPKQWIIVDDGSRDETGRLAAEAALQFEWIKVHHRDDRGFRQAGTGVVAAFHQGYQNLQPGSWDYLVKLDGDVSFNQDYFEQCLAEFAAAPTLGIGGGLVCNWRNGVLVEESKVDPVFHVRGATKIYRQACWAQIGGLMEAPGWDTLDEVKANMRGWTTRTFRHIKVVHHRPAGGAYGTWANFRKNGLANYIAGYHPVFMFLKCVRRLFVRPYGLQALGLWSGFLHGYLARVPQVDDPDLIRYFRRQQLNRLLGRPSLWG